MAKQAKTAKEVKTQPNGSANTVTQNYSSPLDIVVGGVTNIFLLFDKFKDDYTENNKIIQGGLADIYNSINEDKSPIISNLASINKGINSIKDTLSGVNYLGTIVDNVNLASISLKEKIDKLSEAISNSNDVYIKSTISEESISQLVNAISEHIPASKINLDDLFSSLNKNSGNNPGQSESSSTNLNNIVGSSDINKNGIIVIETFNDFIDNINKIIKNGIKLSLDSNADNTIKFTIEGSNSLNKEVVDSFKDLIEAFPIVGANGSGFEEFNVNDISKRIDYFIDLANYINTINLPKIDKAKSIESFIIIGDVFNAINKTYGLISFKNVIKTYIALPILRNALDETGNIIESIYHVVNNVDSKELRNKVRIFKNALFDISDINNLIISTISPIKIAALSSSNKLFKTFITVINNLITSINTINDVDENKLYNVSNLIGDIAKLVLVSSAVLLAAIATGLLVAPRIGSILSFIGGVTLLTFGLMSAILGFNALFKKAWPDMYDSRNNKTPFDPYVKLIAVASGIMMLASLVVHKIDPVSLGLFTLILSGFLFSVISIITTADLLSRHIIGKEKLGSIGKGENPIDNIYKLVISSATILIVSALILKNYPSLASSAMLFAGILAGFIFAVVTAYSIPAAFSKSMLAYANDVKKLIIASTVIMLIGALWVSTGQYGLALLFTAVLSTFILGVVGAYALGSRLDHTGNSLKYALQISALIAVSTVSLMLASGVVNRAGGPLLFTGNILAFTIGMGMLIAGITAIVAGLGVIENFLTKGAMLTFLEIAGLAFVMGIVINSISAVTKKMEEAGGILKLLDTVSAGLLITIGIGLIIGALGGILAIPGAKIILASGSIVFAGILAFAFGIAEMISSMANAAKLAGTVTKEDLDNVMVVIAAQGDIIKAIIKNTNDIKPGDITRARRMIRTIRILSRSTSAIASAIKDFADLTTHNIDPVTGRILSGKRKMTTEDIKKASQNIGLVISTIGGALINTYNSHKEWFEADEIKIGNGLLSLSIPGGAKMTPFYRVVMASSRMGMIIESIANGINAYAKYNFGNTKMSNALFKDAADNIALVITTIGNALINTYKEHTDWFNDTTLLGRLGLRKPENADKRSTFGKIIRATSSMTEIIKDISAVIDQYANYKFNGDSAITNDNIFVRASENISKVISSIFNAITNSYDSITDKSIFDDNVVGWDVNFLFLHINRKRPVEGTSTFSKIVNAIIGITGILNNMMELYSKYDSKDIENKIVSAKISITNIFVALIESYANAINDPRIKNFLKKNKKEDEIVEYVNGIVSTTNELANTIAAFNNEENNIDLTNTTVLDNVLALINKFSEIPIIDEDSKYKLANFTNIVNAYSSVLGNVKDIVAGIDDISKLNDINDFIDKFTKSANLDNYNTDNRKTRDFSNRVKETKEFIKTVNSMDVNKIDSISRFAEAINSLAEHTGDIRSLTDTLNGTFLQTVNKLSNNVESAKQTIKTADELQEKRKKTIADSISKMENIMKSPVVVKVNSTTGESESSYGQDYSTVPTDSMTSGASNSAAIEQAIKNALSKTTIKVNKIN